MSNEVQDQSLQLPDVSSRFSFANIEAVNSWITTKRSKSYDEIEILKPMIEDLRKAVAVLQNGY